MGVFIAALRQTRLARSLNRHFCNRKLRFGACVLCVFSKSRQPHFAWVTELSVAEDDRSLRHDGKGSKAYSGGHMTSQSAHS